MRTRRSKAAHRATDRTALVALLSAAVLAGALIGSLAFPLAPPADLGAKSEVEHFPVESVLFDDPHQLEMRVELAGATTAPSPDAGRITASDCRANAAVASGDELLRLNDQPLIALHTETPLWRPLKIGDTGPDVQSLRDALIALGVSLDPGETVDAALIEAVRDIAKAGPGDDIPVQRLIWLPSPTAAVKTCDAPLGQSIAANDPLVTFTGTIESLSFDPIDPVLDGERNLEIGGVSVPVTINELRDGQLSKDTMTQLNEESALLAEIGRLDEENTTISGQAILTTPVAAYSLPPAAVIPTDLRHGTVCTPSGPQEVDLLGNSLGSTIVQSSVELGGTVSRPTATGSCE